MSENKIQHERLAAPYEGKGSIKSSLIKSLQENSDYNEKDAEKIATKITKDLKGKEVKDVFEKAAKIYDFKNGKNNGILFAIEGLDPNVNIDYKYKDGKGTEAIWQEATSQSLEDDSSDIVKREIIEGPLSEYVRTGKGAAPTPLGIPVKRN